MQHDHTKIIKKKRKIDILTYGETLFNVVISKAWTKEKLIIITIRAVI